MKRIVALSAAVMLAVFACAAQQAPAVAAKKAPAAAQKAPAVAQKAPAAAAKKSAAPKSLDLSTLPPAVQKGIQGETKGATIKNISKEVEKGKTQYEVETTVNGKTRDLLFDANGKTLSIEEETTLEAIPAPAKAAIEKKAGSGKIDRVEILIRDGVKDYEAVFTTKAGKKSEVTVKADGTPAK